MNKCMYMLFYFLCHGPILFALGFVVLKDDHLNLEVCHS